MSQATVLVAYDGSSKGPNDKLERIALEVARQIGTGLLMPGATVSLRRIESPQLAAHVSKSSAGHHCNSDFDHLLLFGPATAVVYAAYKASLVFLSNPFLELEALAEWAHFDLTELADHLYFALRRARSIVQLGIAGSEPLNVLLNRHVLTLPCPAFGPLLAHDAKITHFLVINHGWPSGQVHSLVQRLREQVSPIPIFAVTLQDNESEATAGVEISDVIGGRGQGRGAHIHLGAALEENSNCRVVDSWALGAPIVQLLQHRPAGEPNYVFDRQITAPYVAHRRNGFLCDSVDAALVHVRSVTDDAATMQALVRGGQAALELGNYGAQTLARELVR